MIHNSIHISIRYKVCLENNVINCVSFLRIRCNILYIMVINRIPSSGAVSNRNFLDVHSKKVEVMNIRYKVVNLVVEIRNIVLLNSKVQIYSVEFNHVHCFRDFVRSSKVRVVSTVNTVVNSVDMINQNVMILVLRREPFQKIFLSCYIKKPSNCSNNSLMKVIYSLNVNGLIQWFLDSNCLKVIRIFNMISISNQ